MSERTVVHSKLILRLSRKWHEIRGEDALANRQSEIMMGDNQEDYSATEITDNRDQLTEISAVTSKH